MSRYGVDKVCWHIAIDPSLGDKFLEDPKAFVEGYDLSAEERQALIQMDFVALYKMGANPFLLSQWAGQVLPERKNPDFRDWYAASLAPYGRPDFAT
ncbi:MAG TPA: hypothetical protein VNL15_00095 [Dehalococcoidia bacterium]|nr:hypothetical protein [Dehalococcoidia bacterium]